MVGTRHRTDRRAAELLRELMGDRGLTPADMERASASTGHPLRRVSKRSIYRVLTDGHRPTVPVQFEIAATLGLLPSHIWGRTPLPVDRRPAAAA